MSNDSSHDSDSGDGIPNGKQILQSQWEGMIDIPNWGGGGIR